MYKIILGGGLVFCIMMGFFMYHFFNEDSNMIQQNNEIVSENSVVVENRFYDNESGLTFVLPETWIESGAYQNYEQKEIVLEHARQIIFNYIDSEKERFLLGTYTIYSQKEYSISEIFHIPNTKLLLQNSDYIVAFTPADFDVVIEKTDPDMEEYIRMRDDMILNNQKYNMRFEKGIFTYIEHIKDYSAEEGYDIDILYPVFSGNVDTDFSILNQEVIQNMNKLMTSFKDNLLEIESDEWYNSLFVIFEPKILSADKLSILYSVSEMFAGAAHPMNYVMGYSYDLIKHKSLELDDIFSLTDEGSQEKLFSLIKEKVVHTLKNTYDVDEEMIYTSSLDPIKDNFSNVTLRDDGVVFYFSSGTVAPIALGTIDVFVSYDEWDNI